MDAPRHHDEAPAARPLRRRWVASLAVAALAIAIGAGGCADQPTAAQTAAPSGVIVPVPIPATLKDRGPELVRDPAAFAQWFGEAAITCDYANAWWTVNFGGGWTAVPPGQPDPVRERRERRRTLAQLARCREQAVPGATVTSDLIRIEGVTAVVDVHTTIPDGRTTTVRMRFTNVRRPGEDDNWSRRT